MVSNTYPTVEKLNIPHNIFLYVYIVNGPFINFRTLPDIICVVAAFTGNTSLAAVVGKVVVVALEQSSEVFIQTGQSQ